MLSPYRDIQAKCSELRKKCLENKYIQSTKPFPLTASEMKLKQYYIELKTIWTKGERNHHTESKTRYTEGERKGSSIAQIWQNSDMMKHVATFSSRGDLHNLGQLNRTYHKTLLPTMIQSQAWTPRELVALDPDRRQHVRMVDVYTPKDWDLLRQKTFHLPNLTQLTFEGLFDQPLSPGVLPTSLTHLDFGYYFNQPLSPGVLPTSLTQLTFGSNFNQPLTAGVLPTSLTQLTFGSSFNQPLQVGVLSTSLTHLTFGENFNQSLTAGVLPTSLTHLTFGSDFNQPLQAGVLPSSLIQLTFRNMYDQPREFRAPIDYLEVDEHVYKKKKTAMSSS